MFGKPHPPHRNRRPGVRRRAVDKLPTATYYSPIMAGDYHIGIDEDGAIENWEDTQEIGSVDQESEE